MHFYEKKQKHNTNFNTTICTKVCIKTTVHKQHYCTHIKKDKSTTCCDMTQTVHDIHIINTRN